MKAFVFSFTFLVVTISDQYILRDFKLIFNILAFRIDFVFVSTLPTAANKTDYSHISNAVEPVERTQPAIVVSQFDRQTPVYTFMVPNVAKAANTLAAGAVNFVLHYSRFID